MVEEKKFFFLSAHTFFSDFREWRSRSRRNKKMPKPYQAKQTVHSSEFSRNSDLNCFTGIPVHTEAFHEDLTGRWSRNQPKGFSMYCSPAPRNYPWVDFFNKKKRRKLPKPSEHYLGKKTQNTLTTPCTQRKNRTNLPT